MESEQIRQVIENLRIKFRALNQIYDLTKELDAAFADGDNTSLDMLLDMSCLLYTSDAADEL